MSSLICSTMYIRTIDWVKIDSSMIINICDGQCLFAFINDVLATYIFQVDVGNVNSKMSVTQMCPS